MAAHGGEVRGTLHIGTIAPLSAVDLPDLLAAYRERHPAVRVTLRTRLVHDLVQQVGDHTCDVAFVDTDPREVPRHLTVWRLAEEQLVAIVPPAHRLAGAAQVDVVRLAEEDMVDMPPLRHPSAQ